MKEITLTENDFKEISTDVAAELCMEADEHGVNGHIIAILTAMYCSKLHTKLFKDDKLEVDK